MSVNFGNLDYYGHCAAGDMKDTIRVLAFNTIRNLLTADQSESYLLVERIEGVVTFAEEMCEEIDEEVAHTGAEIQQIMQKYAEGHKDEPSA